MCFVDLLHVSIDRSWVNEIRLCKVVRLRLDAKKFSMLAEPSHAAWISRMCELRIALGSFVDGQRELSVRLWPLLSGHGRLWLLGVRVGVHGASITWRDARRAGHPHCTGTKLSVESAGIVSSPELVAKAVI
jgi:hypothetical protein